VNSAPLDPADLAGALAPFGTSTGLPAAAYRSADVFDWEASRFFAGSWFCVGRSEELVGPAQVRGVRAAGESVLLANDGETVRAFSNVCRHRGHELAPVGAALDARLIRCPYHAWSYRLDGTLKAAPTFIGRLEEDDYPLVELGVATWRGWLFVNLDGGAGSIGAHVGNLDAVVAAYDVAALVTGHLQVYEVDANWKLLIENFNECYHCTSIHPALCELTPVDSGADLVPTGLWCGGTMDLKPHASTMSMDGTTPLPPLPGVSGDALRRVIYVTLFPNLLISAHPDYVLAHRLTPLAPGRTAVECTWLFSPDAVSGAGFDPSYAVDFWDLTNQEDWSVCEGVQRGLANSGYRPGPLSSWEATVYQFLTMVARAYRGGPLTPSPVEERVTR
jgi:phenylpropionate dioxygenase-like ring-hydroxylating dioxygenase large terminal subunit